MRKEHNFVKCLHCAWRMHQKDYDSDKEKCVRCNNTRLVIDPKEILCNLCGGGMCPVEANSLNEQIPHGLHNARVIGGYDSYHLFDMTAYTFSFCEECLRKLFVQCKIKPSLNEVDVFNSDYLENNWDWNSDQKAYEYRLWSDNGGRHQAYLNGKCNLEKDCPNNAIYTYFHYDEFSEDCSCEEHKTENSRSVKAVPFISNTLKVFL